MSSPPAAGTLDDRKLSYASSTQDSAHNDHGARSDGELTWTAEEEKRIVRKIDWRLMPLLWALFMCVLCCVSGRPSG